MKVEQTIKKAPKRFVGTVKDFLPVVVGGGIGAGLGRNSILAAGILYTLSKANKWPEWVNLASFGMVANGIATTKPITETAVIAEEEASTVSGFPKLIPDNFGERTEQYFKNIAMNAYLDKVPVINKAVGLAGVDELESFYPNKTAEINMPAAARTELNRVLAEMSTVAGIDKMETGGQQAVAGLDAMEFQRGSVSGLPIEMMATM